MLRDWNFEDTIANGTTPQVNRQKSASNLTVVALDRQQPAGTFLDPKKGTTNSATLSRCDCNDFKFAGNSPRKSFKPCMHIYRLAMELGLLDAKYEDHSAREARGRREVTHQKEAETTRLRALAPDPKAWGGWNRAIHESGLQQNRQYRAYFILDEELGDVERAGSDWRIHGYRVALEHCDCPDFDERGLPCKHIYAAALAEGIGLLLTRERYLAARAQGLEIVFAYDRQ